MTAIDHVGLITTNPERAIAFYEPALGALGIRLLSRFDHDGKTHAGFGVTTPFFWISSGRTRSTATHVAFRAASRAEVEAFHSIGLASGGRDNGQPGLRPHYHPNYFGAFVFDPDGNNIEAVCHERT